MTARARRGGFHCGARIQSADRRSAREACLVHPASRCRPPVIRRLCGRYNNKKTRQGDRDCPRLRSLTAHAARPEHVCALACRDRARGQTTCTCMCAMHGGWTTAMRWCGPGGGGDGGPVGGAPARLLTQAPRVGAGAVLNLQAVRESPCRGGGVVVGAQGCRDGDDDEGDGQAHEEQNVDCQCEHRPRRHGLRQRLPVHFCRGGGGGASGRAAVWIGVRSAPAVAGLVVAGGGCGQGAKLPVRRLSGRCTRLP